jgi:flagellar hook-associated protein 1
LQNLINQRHPVAAAGVFPARVVSFTDYAAALYQDIAARGAEIDRGVDSSATRLRVAEQSQSQKEGVNLDEELSQMMMLQQAYNAGARLIQVSQQLYDELLKTVGG